LQGKAATQLRWTFVALIVSPYFVHVELAKMTTIRFNYRAMLAQSAVMRQ